MASIVFFESHLVCFLTLCKCASYTHSHTVCLSQQLSKAVAVSLCNQQENIDTQKLSNMSKVTHLGSGRTRIQL